MRITRPGLVVLAVVLLSATFSTAQVNWMSPLHKPGVSLELTKVSLAQPYDFSFWATQYRLSGRFFLGGDFYGLMEIPYVHLGYSNDRYCWYCSNESTIGNPYIGIGLSKETSGAIFQVGARMPFTERSKNDAAEYGQLALFDHWEAFLPRVMTLSSSFGYAAKKPGVFSATCQLGPVFMLPDEGDPELFADFTTELWGEGQRVRVGIGYHLRYLITQSEWDFNECMEHQFAFSGAASLGSFHPGIHLRFPLDKGINQLVKFSYGLDFTVDLPNSNATGSER